MWFLSEESLVWHSRIFTEVKYIFCLKGLKIGKSQSQDTNGMKGKGNDFDHKFGATRKPPTYTLCLKKETYFLLKVPF